MYSLKVVVNCTFQYSEEYQKIFLWKVMTNLGQLFQRRPNTALPSTPTPLNRRLPFCILVVEGRLVGVSEPSRSTALWLQADILISRVHEMLTRQILHSANRILYFLQSTLYIQHIHISCIHDMLTTEILHKTHSTQQKLYNIYFILNIFFVDNDLIQRKNIITLNRLLLALHNIRYTKHFILNYLSNFTILCYT